jgi:hypothetical protein
MQCEISLPEVTVSSSGKGLTDYCKHLLKYSVCAVHTPSHVLHALFCRELPRLTVTSCLRRCNNVLYLRGAPEEQDMAS